jgi:hypothetical protein
MINTPIITSISPVGTGGGNSAASSGGQTAILKLPDGIGQLKPGQVVEAQVVGKDTNQNTKLNVSTNNVSNELTVSTKVSLQTNSTVLLKILANHVDSQGQTQFRAELVSVNGKAPTIPNGLQGDAAANYTTLRAVLPAVVTSTSSPAAPTNADAQAQTVAKGAVLNAVIIKPDAGGTSLLPQPTHISATANKAYGAIPQAPVAPQAQDQLRLHVLNTQSPSVQTTPPTSAQPATQSNYNTYQANTGATTTTGQSSTQPTSTKEAVSAFAARGQINTGQPSGPTPLSTNPIFTGTVIGSERSGEVVVATPMGTIKIATSGPLPQGTVITLEVLSHQTKTQALTQQPAAASIEAANYKTALTGPDSAFEQAFSALQAIDKALVKETFPTTQNQGAAKLLWFIFNTQGGSAAQWLGKETTNQLNKAGHKDTLKKLDSAFGQIRQLFSEPNAAGWHTLVFPFSDGENLQYGRFYTRQTNEEGEKKDDIRFLVEVEFDILGDMQLDGFIHNTKSADQSKKQFDLYIRSKKPVEADMKHHIIELFESSIEATQLRGNLVFQTVETFPVQPDADSHDEGEIIA